MGINKVFLATLRALSYPDIKIKKNYKIIRKIVNISHPNLLKPFYRAWEHKVISGGREIPVRIFNPDKTETPRPVLLFFHGGGWVTGNIDSYDRVCTDMARITKHIVISVDYRLAPEHKFPSGLYDCYFVYKELIKYIDLFKVDKEDITLIGDSAGGNLAAVVSLMARDKGDFIPKRQILIYPATYNDHTEKSVYKSVIDNGSDYLLTSKKICDYMDLYMSSKADINSPYFAPLIAKDFSNQPETLVITAEYDPLRDEGEDYAHKLREAGNNVYLYRIPDSLHGFFQ